MHVLFFVRSEKEVQTVSHSHIYISLLFAACFSFCGKLLSGDKKYIKQHSSNTTPQMDNFSDS
jgi:hypothetical protein